MDRTVAKRKHNKCRQGRQRNGQKDRKRCSKVTEKDQNHDSGQNEANQAFMDEVLNRRLNEDRLVKYNTSDQLLRNVQQMRDGLLDAFDNSNRVGVCSRFQDWQINGSLSINTDDIGLNRCVVLRPADISNQYWSIVDCLQW